MNQLAVGVILTVAISRHHPEMSRTVLVTGATGKQGGSVVAALLGAESNFEILAVTRDATSSKAQKLKKQSPKIKVVQGNLDDSEIIFTNAHNVTSEPIWGVFSVQVGGY